MQALFDSKMTQDEVRACDSIKSLRAAYLDEALAAYAAKEEAIGSEQLREIERRVMLSVIDQHWREHLYEMDYLREGINLRAMGQRDPLAEWQREGFDMFEAMMGSIRDNFVQYVSRLEVVSEEPMPAAPRGLTYSAAEDPVQGSGALAAAAAGFDGEQAALEAFEPEVTQQPVRVEKVPGRNDPCWCGSGKKFKACHGR
jgi:preprotein translocase subunit SecA